MSEQTIGSNNGVQLFVNTDLSRVFLWENRYSKGSLNNADYDPLVMKAGTLLGRRASNQLLYPQNSAATDGSEYPIGVLAEDMTIAEGTTVDVAFCNYGDVSEKKIILHGTDTLSTLVHGRSIRDRIASDTVGIRLIVTDEMTDFDNG